MNSLNQLVEAGILDKDMAELSLGHTGQTSHGEERATRYRGSNRGRDTVDMTLQVEYMDQNEPEARSAPASDLMGSTMPTVYSYDHRPRSQQAHRGSRTVPQYDPVQSYRVDLDTFDDDDYSYYQAVKYHWLYSSQSYGWWHFSEEDNDILEKAYQSGKPDAELTIGGNQFYFDFDKMIQRSRGRSTRNVLRVTELHDIALRGIAGTRIDKDTVTGIHD